MSVAIAQVPDKLIEALVQVESGGNWNAVGDNGKAKGGLQVWKVAVDDVNRVFKTNYTHDDMFDVSKARVVCRMYIGYWTLKSGMEPSMEVMSRIWNGGPKGYKKASTEAYWRKVSMALSAVG